MNLAPEYLLLLTVFLPLAGAILVGVPLLRTRAREVALGTTLFTLLLTAPLLIGFPAEGVTGGAYAVIDYDWVGESSSASVDVRFSVGLDGLGIWMFGLTSLLLVSSVLVSWTAIRERAPLFYSMLLLLEFGCLGVFAARDIILFYVFFEFTLIPLFFLIGIWGSEERRYAAIKFFLFTLAGSMLTFLGLLAIVLWDYSHAGTGVLRFSIPELTVSLSQTPIEPLSLQLLIFVALFAGFAIKVPLFPLHTWLPLAHVQAPTAASVLLAGVLLKIGTYGFVRFSLPMLPSASAAAMPWVLWLAVLGIIYGALVALAQTDIKRLIAYSSVSHLGFCMLGLFALNPLGLQGGTLQMVNHGLSTGALFAIVGMLYERYHTREIKELSGLARRSPWLAFFFVFFTFSSIGLPGLNGFVGEFMVLLGAFQRAWTGTPPEFETAVRVAAVLAVLGVVLGAWYMLWLVRRILFGPVREPHHEHDNGHSSSPVGDLAWREVLALAPLAVFVLWIGVQPSTFLKRMEPTLNPIAAAADNALRKQLTDIERVAGTDPIQQKESRAHVR
jgi:NADH-quinone oxidoreductase subunit M